MDGLELMPFGNFVAFHFPCQDPHISILVSLAIPSKTLLNTLLLAAFLTTSNSPIAQPSKRTF